MVIVDYIAVLDFGPPPVDDRFARLVPRRSREMTHLCSFKVTHTKNTIWRRARISEAISSTPQACGVVFHHPRRSVRKVPIFYEEFRAQVKPINRRDRGGGLVTDLPAGKKPFLPGGKTATLSAWCWVAFGEQTMVISRECRSLVASALETAP